VEPIRMVHSERLPHRLKRAHICHANQPEISAPGGLHLQAHEHRVDDLLFPARVPNLQPISERLAGAALTMKHFSRDPKPGRPKAPRHLFPHPDRIMMTSCRCKSPALPQAADNIAKFDRASSAMARPLDLPRATRSPQCRDNFSSAAC